MFSLFLLVNLFGLIWGFKEYEKLSCYRFFVGALSLSLVAYFLLPMEEAGGKLL